MTCRPDVLLCLSFACLVGMAGSAAGQFSAVHDCDGCHGTIGPASDPTTGTPAEVELLCLSCHGPAGISTLKADIHSTSGGDHTCLTCHNPHTDPDNWLGGVNRKLIGTIDYDVWPWTAKINTPNSGLRDVVFESLGTGASEATLHSFADNDEDANSDYDGVCETCHTLTDHHLNSAPDAGHSIGATCTASCHPHDGGFLSSGDGDCTSCHNSIQGTRRAVVGEFPVSNTHAHYGGAIDNADCEVCHDQSTHQDGYVDLFDADTGGVYRFIQPDDLTNDPDLSDFCASCHDDDGALRLGTPLDPFGNGNAPPDAASQFAGTLQWNEEYGGDCVPIEGTLRAVNSHHDISDTDQAFSGAKVECLDCHGAHNAAFSQPMADPFDTTTAWAGTSNDFCLSCHDGGTGPGAPGLPTGVVGPTVALRGIDSCDYVASPWYVDYSWTNLAHGGDSKRAWPGYSGAPSHVLNCLDCHDQHGSYSGTNTVGNPYMIRDFVDGTAYVDDGVRDFALWTGPPWTTFGVSRDVVVTISGLAVDWGGPTGLCSVCHSNWQSAGDFHLDCTDCQTCHAHGAAFENNDWGGGDNDTPCPPPALLKFFGTGEVSSGTPLHGAEPDWIVPMEFVPGVLTPDTHDARERRDGR